MGATGAKRWRRREHYRPSNNLCPGRQSPALHRGDAPGELELTTMAFGLVPSYTDKAARPDFFRMANARSETVSAQPAFRRLLAHRRCVVPIDGFYEWLPEPQRKQPFYISSAACAGDRAGEPQLLWIAALWDVWHAQDGTELPTYALLTRDVSPELAWLHDRMPVVLDAKSARAWLDVGGTDPLDALRTCLRASPIELRWHKVHPRMSVVKYDGDDAHLPWTPTPITAFFERMPPKGEATPAPAPAARTDDAAGARVDADATPNKVPTSELQSDERQTAPHPAEGRTPGACGPVGLRGGQHARWPEALALAEEDAEAGMADEAAHAPRSPERSSAARSPSTPTSQGAEAPAASPPTELRSESKRFKRTEADASGAGASLARAGAPPDTPPQLARRKAPAAMPRTRPASANRTQPGISSFFHRV